MEGGTRKHHIRNLVGQNQLAADTQNTVKGGGGGQGWEAQALSTSPLQVPASSATPALRTENVKRHPPGPLSGHCSPLLLIYQALVRA